MRYIIFLFFCLVCGIAYSQSEGTAFNNTGRGGTATTFASDYQALGINPANIAHFGENTSLTFGFGELGIAFYSDALRKTDVRTMLLGRNNPITRDEAIELGKSFADAGMSLNYDMRAFGIGFEIGKAGALAFSVDAHASHYSILGETASSLIFEGYNFADYFDTIISTPEDTFGVAYDPLSFYQIAEGTRIKGSANVAFNGGWGIQAYADDFITLRLGVGAKYVLSYAYYDLNATENSVEGYTAITDNPFDLTAVQTPSDIYNNFKPVGKGIGVDLGVNVTLNERFDIGVSVVDIGTIKYNANLIAFDDFLLDTVRFSGLTTTNPTDMMTDIIEDESLIEFNGAQKLSASMPTSLRLGLGYRILEFLDLGADIVMPLVQVANSYPEPFLGLGAELRILNVLKISSGVTMGGGYKTAIPFGVGLDFDIWEFGVASRDATTWFGQNSPYVSLTCGFLRFKL